jgi:hypothetical protein
MLTQVSNALFIAELIAQAMGQTTCAPLMQALVQQAEATNGYGSWDACCARTGVDCFLSRVVVPAGEPCDNAHSARAGCNKLTQGTVCMIGEDGLIYGSPCGASIIRTYGSIVALGGGGGVALPFEPLGATSAPQAILARGILNSPLCCSTTGCTFTSPCIPSRQYSMSACISDGVNFICMPFDQADNTTYAAQIVVVNSSTNSSSPTSMTPQGGGVSTQDVVNKKHGLGGNAAIIGGSVGGAVGFVCIAILSIFLCARIRGPRTINVPSNEWPNHQGAAARTNQVRFFPGLSSAQNVSGYTPSFPSHPSPQLTSAVGNLPPFSGPSHQNQNAFEVLANPQNPSQVHQDPQENVITNNSHQDQNTLEFPANRSQVCQDPDASIISRPALQLPISPPPPPSYITNLPSPVVDTREMEARIAALENRIIELSGPSSGVQVRGSGRGGAEAGPPRYDDKE